MSLATFSPTPEENHLHAVPSIDEAAAKSHLGAEETARVMQAGSVRAKIAAREKMLEALGELPYGPFGEQDAYLRQEIVDLHRGQQVDRIATPVATIALVSIAEDESAETETEPSCGLDEKLSRLVALAKEYGALVQDVLQSPELATALNDPEQAHAIMDTLCDIDETVEAASQQVASSVNAATDALENPVVREIPNITTSSGDTEPEARDIAQIEATLETTNQTTIGDAFESPVHLTEESQVDEALAEQIVEVLQSTRTCPLRFVVKQIYGAERIPSKEYTKFLIALQGLKGSGRVVQHSQWTVGLPERNTKFEEQLSKIRGGSLVTGFGKPKQRGRTCRRR